MAKKFLRQGKPGRKDMLGITANLDFHAIAVSSNRKLIKPFLSKYPDIFSDGKEVATDGKRGAIWKRHLEF